MNRPRARTLPGPDLVDALGAREGVVCAVGAGGKKTTLYALAAAHPGRIGLTATVMTLRFPRRLGAAIVTDDAGDLPAAVAAAAAESRLVAWARPSTRPGRLAGIAPDEVTACHRAGGFDLTLVKADGARMRAIKAPAGDEPVVPSSAATVLVVVSATAFGRPLDEQTAHRPERIAAVAGLTLGDAITPAAVAALLSAPAGALHNLPPSARIIPVINAVDDDARERAAVAAAREALTRTERFDHVALTSYRRASALVAVVDRK